MHTKTTFRLMFFITLLTALAVLAWPVMAQETETTSLVPMGASQTDDGRYRAYRAVFGRVHDGGRAHWAAADFTAGGASYGAGAFLVPGGIDGNFSHADLPGAVLARPSYALYPRRFAVLRSTAQDEYEQPIDYELADIRTMFENYLWNRSNYGVLTEVDVAGGALDGYDALILPAVRVGYAEVAADDLGANGRAAILAFVENGGLLYAQSNGAYIAEACGVVPVGTVTLYGLSAPLDNELAVTVDDPTSPIAFSWVDNTMYVMNDDPALLAQGALSPVASYADDGAPAILSGPVGLGQVVLVSGHATRRPKHYPIFLNALLWTMAEKSELVGQAIQTYSPNVPADTIPAYEAGVPISVTLTFNNLWNADLGGVVVTEEVQPGFVVDTGSFSTPPLEVNTAGGVTAITWHLSNAAPGEFDLSYTAQTVGDALKKGEATFSLGRATYGDQRRMAYNGQGRIVTVEHRPFRLRARMAARLVGDRDIELDRAFTIPEDGNYFDVNLVIENKEDTLANELTFVDVVPLIAPIVDMEDQHKLLATNDGYTVWMRNEPFFYDEEAEIYEPADGYARGQTITLADWDGVTVYTYTCPGGYHLDTGMYAAEDTGSVVTIPPTYSTYIKVTADHKLVLPALALTWNYGGFPGYEYKEPMIRYGLNSRELEGRAVSFTGDPVTGTVVVNATSGSVYTNLGEHPIFSREYVTSAVAYAPEYPEPSRVAYEDIWERPHELLLRSAFYDVFGYASCASCGPGTGGEAHAAINVTFGMWVDKDDNGDKESLVKELPTRMDEADLTIKIKTRNLGTGIGRDENVIDEGIFHGLGIAIEPRHGTWWDSYRSSYSTLEGISSTVAYDHLFFQQEVPAGATEVIDIDARIRTYPDVNAEGMLKLHDGARFSYRQQFAGPSRYEVYDSHVQGVVGIRSDAELDKEGAPIMLSTYGDTLYYIFTLKDEHDPRVFNEDPYLQSYGFGDMAATTYVGGREKKQILHSIVSPGGSTRLRVEVNNNSGQDITDFSLTPQPPAGVNCTPLYTGGDTVPPIFFDFPFLNAATIPDAWKGVYYFELTVSPDFGDVNRVHKIPFALGGQNIPAGFEVPPATLAVVSGGRAWHTYGSAVGLVLTDTVPSWVTMQELRLADESQRAGFDAAVVAGTEDAYYNDNLPLVGTGGTLPLDGFVLYPLDDGRTMVSFGGLPASLPQPDGAHFYLIAKASTDSMRSGSRQANEGGLLSYNDTFGLPWSDPGDPVQVEVHGAFVETQYYVDYMERTFNGDELHSLFPGEENTIEVVGDAINLGDYIAEGTAISVELPVTITFLSASSSVVISDHLLFWPIGDLAPGSYDEITFTISYSPPLSDTDQTAIALRQADYPAWINYPVEALPLTSQCSYRFVDDYTGSLINGQTDEALWLPVLRPVLNRPLNLFGRWWSEESLAYLFWTGLTGEDVDYYVYRSDNLRTGFKLIAQTDGATDQYDYTPDAAPVYYYTVVAVDRNSNQGIHSNIIMVGQGRNDVFLPAVGGAWEPGDVGEGSDE